MFTAFKLKHKSKPEMRKYLIFNTGAHPEIKLNCMRPDMAVSKSNNMKKIAYCKHLAHRVLTRALF
jgi:hypothetical protein